MKKHIKLFTSTATAIAIAIGLPGSIIAQQTQPQSNQFLSAYKSLATKYQKAKSQSQDQFNLKQVLKQVPSNEEWLNAEKIELSYSQNGDYSEYSFSFEFDSNSWEPNWDNVVQFDGNNAVKTYRTYQDDEYSNETRSITSYTTGNTPNEIRIESITEQYWDGMNWANDTKDEFQYTLSGVVSAVVSSVWNGESWDLTDKSEIAAVGEDIQEIQYEFYEGKWEFTGRVIYKNLTRQELDEQFNKPFEVYAHYGLNTLVRELPNMEIQEFIDGGWVTVSNQYIEKQFDAESGKLVSETFTYEIADDEGTLAPFSRYIYEVDTDGRVTTTSMDINQGIGWQHISEETITYNASNLIETITQQYNLGWGLMTVGRLTFSYDVSTPIEKEIEQPANQFEISSIYPNPFNPSTTIKYSVNQTGKINVQVFDILGRSVATLFDGVASEGIHQLKFDAVSLSSGTYIVRISNGSSVQTQKLSLIK
ncbi:T9SS type A sorting domain-containing protein [bacterium]|nr:MAG: T9SS type A sorting domain-containing protein [bacterium]